MDSVMRFMFGSIPSLDTQSSINKRSFQKERVNMKVKLKISCRSNVLDLRFQASSLKIRRS